MMFVVLFAKLRSEMKSTSHRRLLNGKVFLQAVIDSTSLLLVCIPFLTFPVKGQRHQLRGCDGARNEEKKKINVKDFSIRERKLLRQAIFHNQPPSRKSFALNVLILIFFVFHVGLGISWSNYV